MQAVVFRNPGVIDPRSITTFGTSSKENAGAIGFFGTGLKYAIAVLLRLGCSITIHSGGKQYGFAVKTAKIRVNSFDIVTMNGKALGFTTELGKTWEAWMALRELWCNAKDEGGEAYQAMTDHSTFVPMRSETVVVVYGQPMLDAWANRGDVILESEPLEKLDSVHIHPGPSKYVYYKGIRIHELQYPSLNTYNVQRRIDLTEDRTAKYTFEVMGAITSGITKSERSELVRRAVLAEKGSCEYSLDYSGQVPSDNFVTTVAVLARGHDSRLSRSALEAVRVWRMEVLNDPDKPMPLNEVEEKALVKAVDFCRGLGYAVDDYTIIPSEFLGDNVLGQADRTNQRIYLSRQAFQMGTKTLAGTLIEEYLHIKHNLSDESRALQNFLLDALVSLGERIKGEPL